MILNGTNEIITENLILRRFRLGDGAELYHNVGQDQSIYEYITWSPCCTLESAETFVNENVQRYQTDEHYYSWAVTLHGSIIGYIGVYDIDKGMLLGEIGFTIASKWAGRGYASEAVAALLYYMFEEVGFHGMSAWHDTKNMASGRVLQKNGMIIEGIARKAVAQQDGTYDDKVYYGILKSDYDRRTQE